MSFQGRITALTISRYQIQHGLLSARRSPNHNITIDVRDSTFNRVIGRQTNHYYISICALGIVSTIYAQVVPLQTLSSLLSQTRPIAHWVTTQYRSIEITPQMPFHGGFPPLNFKITPTEANDPFTASALDARGSTYNHVLGIQNNHYYFIITPGMVYLHVLIALLLYMYVLICITLRS